MSDNESIAIPACADLIMNEALQLRGNRASLRTDNAAVYHGPATITDLADREQDSCRS